MRGIVNIMMSDVYRQLVRKKAKEQERGRKCDIPREAASGE